MAATLTPVDYQIVDGSGAKAATKRRIGNLFRAIYNLKTDATSASFTVPFREVKAILGLPGLSDANLPTFTPDGLGNTVVAIAGGLTSTVNYRIEVVGR